jgi:hypothetical protein
MQNDWPSKTWRNPDRSPLIAAAASVRGSIDLLKVVVERMLGWIPRFLEKLDECLCNAVGGRWWNDDRFQPRLAEVPPWVIR